MVYTVKKVFFFCQKDCKINFFFSNLQYSITAAHTWIVIPKMHFHILLKTDLKTSIFHSFFTTSYLLFNGHWSTHTQAIYYNVNMFVMIGQNIIYFSGLNRKTVEFSRNFQIFGSWRWKNMSKFTPVDNSLLFHRNSHTQMQNNIMECCLLDYSFK